MHARSEVHVAARAGGDGLALTRWHCEPPLTVRHTVDGLTMMASAGGPLGGDDLGLTLQVGADASVRVGSAAATLVLPGPAALRPPPPASLTWTVTVDEHASLDWRPEPTVVAQGAVLRAHTTVTVTGTSRVRWREVLAAGRVGEHGGDALTSWSVVIAGRSLLRQDVHIGPHAPIGWDGLAGTAGMRVLGTLLVVEPTVSPLSPFSHPSHSTSEHAVAPSGERALAPGIAQVDDDGWLAVLPLEGPGTLVTALGPTTAAVTRLLDQAETAMPSPRCSEPVRVSS